MTLQDVGSGVLGFPSLVCNQAAVRALSPSQTVAGLCISHLSHLLLPALLSSQVVPVGLWPCVADLGDFALGHGGQPGAHLGFSSLSRNGNTLLVKLKSQGLRPVLPQGYKSTRATRDACCFCDAH